MAKYLIAFCLLLAACNRDSGQSKATPENPVKTLKSSTDSGEKASPFFKFSVKCGKDSLLKFFDDTTEGYSHYVTHKFHPEIKFPAGYFIERNFYEGRDWLFVNKISCEEIELFGESVFNPSRTKFASIGNDNAEHSGENGIQILSDADVEGSVKIEIEDRISYRSEFGPSEWKWENDSVFSVLLADFGQHKFTRTYRFENGMWTVRNMTEQDSEHK